MSSFFRRVLSGDATPDQAKDTGMAIVLGLLLVWLAARHDVYVMVALGVHLVTMTAAKIFRPAAVVWFGFAELLGTVMSKVILALVFFVVVTPIGLARKALGVDSLQLRAFKAGRNSVMVARNKTFVGSDLERPY